MAAPVAKVDLATMIAKARGLLGVAQALCEGPTSDEALLGGEDESLGSRRDYEAFRKLLDEAAEGVEREVNKLFVGWRSMRTPEQVDGLLRGFLRHIEMLVSCAHLVGRTEALSCEAARHECGAAVVNVMAAVCNALDFVNGEGQQLSDAEWSAAGPPRAGAVWGACKTVRQLAKTNAVAAKRSMLRNALVIKDVHSEFAAVLESGRQAAAEGAGESDQAEPPVAGGSEDEPEVGTEEWYEMMDDLEGDDSMDEDDLVRLDSALKLLRLLGLYVQACLKSVGIVASWEGGDGDGDSAMSYVAWLNANTAFAARAQEAANRVGMTLYPPHDSGAVHAAAQQAVQTVENFHETFRGASHGGGGPASDTLEQLDQLLAKLQAWEQ